MDRYLTKDNKIALIRNRGETFLVEFRDERGREYGRLEMKSMDEAVGELMEFGWQEIQPYYYKEAPHVETY